MGTFFTNSGPSGFVQTLTGNSGGPVGPTGGNINVVGTGTITVVGNPGASTLTITPSGSIAASFPTDSGTATPALGVLNIFGAHGINTSGSGNTVTVAVNNTLTLGDLSPATDALTATTGNVKIVAGNLALPTTSGTNAGVVYINTTPVLHAYNSGQNAFIGGSGNFTLTGTGNLGCGFNSLPALTNGGLHTAVGSNALQSSTSNSSCVAVGNSALAALTTNGSCTALGYFAAGRLTGSSNVAIGSTTLSNATGASAHNICIGTGAATNYTTNESSNIILGENAGTVAESNVMRLGGGTGSGNGQQNKCYISGINGSSITPTAYVVIDGNDQLSTHALNIVSKYTVVNASPYVVTATDYYMTVDTSTIPITIRLPDAPTQYRTFVIKDSAGNASVNNITVTTVSGILNIDAATTFVMNSNYQSIQLIYSGFGYEVY